MESESLHVVGPVDRKGIKVFSQIHEVLHFLLAVRRAEALHETAVPVHFLVGLSDSLLIVITVCSCLCGGQLLQRGRGFRRAHRQKIQPVRFRTVSGTKLSLDLNESLSRTHCLFNGESAAAQRIIDRRYFRGVALQVRLGLREGTGSVQRLLPERLLRGHKLGDQRDHAHDGHGDPGGHERAPEHRGDVADSAKNRHSGVLHDAAVISDILDVSLEGSLLSVQTFYVPLHRGITLRDRLLIGGQRILGMVCGNFVFLQPLVILFYGFFVCAYLPCIFHKAL